MLRRKIDTPSACCGVFDFNADWKIAYDLIPAENQNFTPGMQHFLISTADAIAEDFVLKDFAGEDVQQLIVRDRGILGRQSPGTRYKRDHHSLEEYQVARIH